MEAVPTVETAVQWIATWFLVYWTIFACAYFGPFSPKDDSTKRIQGGPSTRLAFSNRVCSVCHATTDVITSAYIMWLYMPNADTSRRLFLPLAYDQPTDPAFHWVLPVLMAYCLADAVYMSIFERDTLMTIHHIAVVIGVLPLYLMPHGWMLGVVSTFFAEITNPLQNTWQYMRDYGSKSVYQALSLPFTLAFGLFRGIIMPIFLVDYFLFVFVEAKPGISDDNVRAMGVCVVIFTMGWFASLVWLKGVVSGYVKYRRKQAKAAKAAKAQ